MYRSSSIKPPGGLVISNTFEGGGGGSFDRAGLFNLANKMVSVLHKELECKAKVQEDGGHAAEDKKTCDILYA